MTRRDLKLARTDQRTAEPGSSCVFQITMYRPSAYRGHMIVRRFFLPFTALSLTGGAGPATLKTPSALHRVHFVFNIARSC